MNEFTHRASGVRSGGSVEKRANGVQLKDNRPQAVLQKKQVETLVGESAERRVIQQKANHTGLSDQLKSGVENLSGLSMDEVK
ncbi:MAG: hypothetical protein M3N14_03500, partial [Bacteroidota bacterium]|nr:hypothetical protein [Bacteroidota bacterium]